MEAHADGSKVRLPDYVCAKIDAIKYREVPTMVRRAFEPSAEQRETVREMTAHGIPVDCVRLAIRHPHNGRPLSKPTVYKYFADEIEEGHARADAAVVGRLFRDATSDDPRTLSAAIFWAKTRLGWSERTRLEHSGPEGAPITMAAVNLSDAELEAIVRGGALCRGNDVPDEGVDD